jgi:hypothetical protein
VRNHYEIDELWRASLCLVWVFTLRPRLERR